MIISTNHAILDILLKVHGDFLFCRTKKKALFAPSCHTLESNQAHEILLKDYPWLLFVYLLEPGLQLRMIGLVSFHSIVLLSSALQLLSSCAQQQAKQFIKKIKVIEMPIKCNATREGGQMVLSLGISALVHRSIKNVLFGMH